MQAEQFYTRLTLCNSKLPVAVDHSMEQKAIPIVDIDAHCSDRPVRNLKVASFREEACTQAEFEEAHRHAHYEIIWLRKGEGVHQIDMVPYPYSGSTVFLLSPGQVHQLKPTEKADGFVIKFLASLFRDARDLEESLIATHLFDNIQVQPLLKVSDAAHLVYDDFFKTMELEFNADEADKEGMLLAYLKLLLTHLGRLKKHQTGQETMVFDPNYALFQRYKTAIEQHYRQEHGVYYYANLLATQPRTLNALCQKYTGKTAGRIIAERITLEARRELYHESYRIKEISFQLGFEDPAYFTRFFRKQTGLSPQAYKLTIVGNK